MDLPELRETKNICLLGLSRSWIISEAVKLKNKYVVIKID
jgi:hypothetical protein